MGIDPVPKKFAGDQTLPPGRAIDAHDIRRKPVAIASTEATSMVGSVVSGLQAARDRLAVVIAERAGYARRQARLLGDMKHLKELPLEITIHTADYVTL